MHKRMTEVEGLIEVLDRLPAQQHDWVRAVAAAVEELGVKGLQDRLWLEPVEGVLEPYLRGKRPTSEQALGQVRVMNVIPSPPGASQACTPWVLAVASGSRAPGGWAMVVRLLRAHLIECGVGPQGLRHRTALLVTDTFVRRAWYESYRDFWEHAQRAGLTLVVMHWNGKRIRGVGV